MIPQRQNSKTGDCEVCEKTNIVVTLHYGNMWFCDDCWKKEELATAEHQSPQAQQARVDALVQHNAAEVARALDNTVEVRTDLFNAATVSILAIKTAIDEDSTITNKPYVLAEQLLARFQQFKEKVFSLNQQLIEAGNEQKAIQIYLNNLANQLRVEERDKLKIQDISYKPSAPKTVKPVGTRQTSKKTKIDKAELRKYASELGVAEFTLQMLCVSKGITVETAANMLRRSIKEAQSIDTPAEGQ